MTQPTYTEVDGSSPVMLGILGALVREKDEMRAEFINAYITESVKTHGKEVEHLARIEAPLFIERIPVPVLGMVVQTLMERNPHYRERFSAAMQPEVVPVFHEPGPVRA